MKQEARIYKLERLFSQVCKSNLTLIFDLLTSEIDHFMPLFRGPLVSIFNEIGLFVCKISCLQHWTNKLEKTDR